MNEMYLLYVDPGSGLMLAQFVTAVAGAIVILKDRIMGVFRKGDGRNEAR